MVLRFGGCRRPLDACDLPQGKGPRCSTWPIIARTLAWLPLPPHAATGEVRAHRVFGVYVSKIER